MSEYMINGLDSKNESSDDNQPKKRRKHKKHKRQRELSEISLNPISENHDENGANDAESEAAVNGIDQQPHNQSNEEWKVKSNNSRKGIEEEIDQETQKNKISSFEELTDITENVKKFREGLEYKFQQRRNSVALYEQEILEKKEQYQSGVEGMEFEERLEYLKQREEDLTSLEKELDCRFQDCLEYKKEIEEIEKYLERRQDMCNDKEEDLKEIDKELGNYRKELELQSEDLGGSRKNSVFSRTSSKATNASSIDELEQHEYILEMNMKKTQSDLKEAQRSNVIYNKELSELKEEILANELEKKKLEQKVKNLESQLSIALVQLNKRSPSVSSSSVASSVPNRNWSVHKQSVNRQVSLQRQSSNDPDLSINQKAQLRRGRKYTDANDAPPSESGKTLSDSFNSRSSLGGGKMDSGVNLSISPTHQDRSKGTISKTCSIM